MYINTSAGTITSEMVQTEATIDMHQDNNVDNSVSLKQIEHNW